MGSSIRLGRIAGIPVGAHWSLLVIGMLLTVTLADGLLPATVDASTGAYWAAGVFGAVLFLASILAHELSHALVARRNDVVVEDITLWILGGVARLKADAQTARAHLAIALAGPAMSLVAGVVFLGIAVGLAVLDLDVLAVTFSWLALVNGILAVFNLLPGAPLDGGRVLAAVLWMRHGDRTRAAVSAARAGRVLGWTLIALGLANVFFAIGFGTLWTALIGWFIVNASRAEELSAMVRGELEHHRVADVMNAHPAVVPDWITVDEALRAGFPGGARAALLQRFPEGDIVGVITVDALLAVPIHERAHARLADVGVPKERIVTARPDDLAGPLFESIADAPVVVLHDGQVVGLIGLDELARMHEHDAGRPVGTF
jgi:Zn-dependent protease